MTQSHNANNFLKIQKFDADKRKNLKSRSITSIFIVLYWILLILFCWFSSNFSDNSPLWFPYIPEFAKGIMAIIFLILLFPLVFISSYEINFLYFGKHSKFSFSVLALIGFIILIIPNLSYIVMSYFYNNLIPLFPTNSSSLSIKASNTLWLFVISFFLSIGFLIALLSVLYKKYRINDFKKIITLFLICFFTYFGIFSIAFVGLLKQWVVLIYLAVVIISCDTFAYLGGSLFGKHKMSPIISPKKTWEGFCLGMFFSIAFGLLISFLFSLDKNNAGVSDALNNLIHSKIIYKNDYGKWFFLLCLVIFIYVFSTLGDLFYSYVKRAYNVKDYGWFLKGHGGVLDRFDSIFFSFTVYTFLLFILSGFSNVSLFG